MAINVELRRRINQTFDNENSLILIRSHWSLVDGKPPSFVPTSHGLLNHTVSNLTTGDFLKATGAETFAFGPHGLTKEDLQLENVPNVDATNPANITQSASYRFVSDTEKTTWNSKENSITAGLTSQYFRGDKTWQALNKSAVFLGSVENYGIATQIEAEQGISSTKYMTPQRTSQAIAEQSPAGPRPASDVYSWAKEISKPTYSKSEVELGNVDNTSDANKPVSTAQQSALNLKLNTSLKGVANGLAELGSDGKVPTSQLPSYVDDVLEYATLANFPAIGETGKIYVALNTNVIYRWSGSGYVEISSSLALGETSSTAYRGDRGKIAYDHSQLTAHNPHNTTKTHLGLSAVENYGIASQAEAEGGVASNKYMTPLRVAQAIAQQAGQHAPVTSVAGKTGIVTLAKGDVDLENVPNVDATNPVNISWTASNRTVTDTEKTNWNNAYGWGDHAGLYKGLGWFPTWTEVSNKPSWIGASKPSYTPAEVGAEPELPISTNTFVLLGDRTWLSRNGIDSRSSFPPSSHAITAHASMTANRIIGRISTAGVPQELTAANVRTIITDSSNRLITDAERTNWNAAKTHADSAHAPSNAQANQTITAGTHMNFTATAGDVTITHSGAAGSLHIPTGGDTGQILQYGGFSGTAVWKTNGTTSQYLRGDGSWGTPPNTWRGIDSTPVSGQEAESISSGWAFSHLDATNPHGVTAVQAGAMSTSHAANAITSTNITNWNAAHSWGDHASAGYLTVLPSHTHGNLANDGVIGGEAAIASGDHIVVANGTLNTINRATLTFGSATNTYLRNDGTWQVPPDNNTNYYLTGVTKSGNTLTFTVSGATNPTYTFGSNAFTSYTDHTTAGYLSSLPDHAHGNINNDGTISAAVVTPASGDTIVITDATFSGAISRGITIGSGTTTYLRNDGNWGTPPNTTYSAMSVAEGEAGTATTSRTVRADYLRQIIEHYASPRIVTVTAGFTVGTTHRNAMVRVNTSSNITITLATMTGLEIGDEIHFLRSGSGTVTFAQGYMQAIQSTKGTGPKIGNQHGAVTAKYVASNTWAVFGDLS